MLGGFYLSLMPSLIVSATQARSPWLGGFAVTALTLSGALAIALVALRRVGTFRTLLSGEIALASGLLLILIAANAGYPPCCWPVPSSPAWVSAPPSWARCAPCCRWQSRTNAPA